MDRTKNKCINHNRNWNLKALHKYLRKKNTETLFGHSMRQADENLENMLVMEKL